MTEPKWKSKEEYEQWKEERRKSGIAIPVTAPAHKTDVNFWVITSLKAVSIIAVLSFIIYMSMQYDKFLPVIIILAIVPAIFLLIRELLLWYWRINHIVQRLDAIIDRLEYLAPYQDNKPL